MKISIRIIFQYPSAPAFSFLGMHGLNYVMYFMLSQHQSQMAMGQMGGANMANLAAMQQSRMLAETLSSNNDPKFQVFMMARFM